MTLMTSSMSIFKFSQVFFKNNILKHFTQDRSTNRILLRVLVFAGPSDPVVCQISRLQLTEFMAKIMAKIRIPQSHDRARPNPEQSTLCTEVEVVEAGLPKAQAVALVRNRSHPLEPRRYGNPRVESTVESTVQEGTEAAQRKAHNYDGGVGRDMTYSVNVPRMNEGNGLE